MMFPESVNLMALLTKLSMTCCKRMASPMTTLGTPEST